MTKEKFVLLSDFLDFSSFWFRGQLISPAIRPDVYGAIQAQAVLPRHSVTERPQLAGDRLKRAPSLIGVAVSVDVHRSLLPIPSRRRHDNVVVCNSVTLRCHL